MHENFMLKAIEQAKESLKHDEVPVGAVIVCDNEIISNGINTKVSENNPLGHAEINAIHEAVKKTGKLYLDGMTMYVTLEPCIMCSGAIILARISNLVIGCIDEKTGAFGSLYDLSKDSRLNHKVEVVMRVCEEECRKMLKDFFKKLRK
jgi:tRNA(adenine34) deaminase